jgi:hypothetical protein
VQGWQKQLTKENEKYSLSDRYFSFCVLEQEGSTTIHRRMMLYQTRCPARLLPLPLGSFSRSYLVAKNQNHPTVLSVSACILAGCVRNQLRGHLVPSESPRSLH